MNAPLGLKPLTSSCTVHTLTTGRTKYWNRLADVLNRTLYNLPLSSSTYRTSGKSVSVRYTQGDWQGELGSDFITIPQGLNGTIVINIAAILTSDGFFLPGINWQGILGLAYPILARVRQTTEALFGGMLIWMWVCECLVKHSLVCETDVVKELF